jgi:hypothetical protein
VCLGLPADFLARGLLQAECARSSSGADARLCALEAQSSTAAATDTDAAAAAAAARAEADAARARVDVAEAAVERMRQSQAAALVDGRVLRDELMTLVRIGHCPRPMAPLHAWLRQWCSSVHVYRQTRVLVFVFVAGGGGGCGVCVLGARGRFYPP